MRFFLDPSRPLAREVVAWLCGDENYPGRVRIVDGAHSLSHVMVVVPTAQSGRNLRLLLAMEAHKRGWGGLLSPRVVLPMQLVKGANPNLREAQEVVNQTVFGNQNLHYRTCDKACKAKAHDCETSCQTAIIGEPFYQSGYGSDVANT